MLLIALNTVLETGTPLDWARGEVGASQLNSLNIELAKPDYTDWVKILFFHHHPFKRHSLIEQIRDKIILDMEDSSTLLSAIDGKVQVVLFGHKHCSGCWQGKKEMYILGSGKSYDWNTASEIIIENKQITVHDIPSSNNISIWERLIGKKKPHGLDFCWGCPPQRPDG